jgi:ABC-type Fe3+/spermidine/putrescine transport system ATPase subunit
LNIKKGQIVAILGRVGSGKTALLSALAGNLELIEAEEFRVVANKIGWLDQRP